MVCVGLVRVDDGNDGKWRLTPDSKIWEAVTVLR